MMTVSSIPSVFKKPIVSENIFWVFLTTIFLHFFQNIDFIGFEKDTLKVCSQKFVKTIDKDKSICYNKAKLRDRNKKTKKAENEYKK